MSKGPKLSFPERRKQKMIKDLDIHFNGIAFILNQMELSKDAAEKMHRVIDQLKEYVTIKEGE